MLQLQFLNIAKPPMWLVESNYSIGSANDANCLLNQLGVMPQHASLVVDGENIQILPLAGVTRINGNTIKTHTSIKHGDTLDVGGVIISLLDPKIQRRALDKTEATELNRWQLQPISTALDPKVIRLSGSMIIGRAHECEICLNFAHLSRRHASLTITPLGLEVEDLGSSNGTFVNGNKIRRVQLRNGDVLSFDAIRFRILGPDDDIEKTSLLPSINECMHPTQLLRRPSSEPLKANNRPVVTASFHPSSSTESDAIRRSRLMLLSGLGLVALIFGSLILYLLR